MPQSEEEYHDHKKMHLSKINKKIKIIIYKLMILITKTKVYFDTR